MKSLPTYENSKARFEYAVEDTLECGIVLRGSEVKQVRSGGGIKLVDTYARVDGSSVVSNIGIGSCFEHVLLVTRRQAEKLKETVMKPGFTLVPLKMYFKHGLVKVLLGVCRGKKTYDKRAAIRDRDSKRDLQRTLKNY